MDTQQGYVRMLPGESQRVFFCWVLCPVMHHNQFCFFCVCGGNPATWVKAPSFIDVLLFCRGDISPFHLSPCWPHVSFGESTKRTFLKVRHTPEYWVQHTLYTLSVSSEQHLPWCCFLSFSSWHDVAVRVFHLLGHVLFPPWTLQETVKQLKDCKSFGSFVA